MELITVTEENLEKEHICCAISNNKDVQVVTKKRWLQERFADGLVFTKGNVRGKCFIEYIPAEKAWAPVVAPGYMYIDCLWVSGQFKGQGYSNLLFESCVEDSKVKGKAGIVVLSSKKKQAFLADPGYLEHKGFLPSDEAEPFFQLMYLPFSEGGPVPRFGESVKAPRVEPKGFMLYYGDQCPFTAKYVPLLEKLAEGKGVPFKAVHFESAEQAQCAPSPFTSFSLFYNGMFVTHEILSEGKFLKIIEKMA